MRGNHIVCHGGGPGEGRGAIQTHRTHQSFPAGTTVFHEGDLGHEMYGVVYGEIRLVIGNRVIASLGEDEVFGEMALLDGSPRSTMALAAKHTVLAVIDRDRFLDLAHEMPLFALQVMTTMAERLRTEGLDDRRERLTGMRAV